MSAEARRDLARHGRLRAGINERNPVLVSARAPDGGPDGVAPALAAELAARLAVPLDLVPYPSAGAIGRPQPSVLTTRRRNRFALRWRR